mgnify:FL=1|jgi:hypothetical protein
MAKTNTKAISNEEIIAALLQHGTIKDAAAAAGTTPRTIYDRMNDREFRAEYMEAKNDIIRKAVFTINEKLSAAIDAVAEIMTDKDNNPAVRLQAAQTILNNAGKFAERLTHDEYQSRNEGKSPFDFDF